jgi:hypothetical protein
MLKYKDFSLIKPDNEQVKKISQLIDKKNGSIFQEVDLNKIVEKEFNSDLFYLVDSPNKIENFSPVHIIKKKFGLKRYHFKPFNDIPYGGFINDNDINFDNLSIGFFESLNYCGLPRVSTDKKNSQIMKYGETSIIDLRLEEDDIFNNIIHSKRRNMIRKASKVGIIIKNYFNNDGFNEFWPFLDSMHQKVGFYNYTFEYYNKLIQHYMIRKQAFISIAYKDNKAISGILVLGNKNYMHYYKGASLFGVKNEGHGELLQWEAIKKAKSLGTKYYDLCNLEKEKLPAIYRFKTGISKNIVTYSKYAKNNFGYKILNKI